MLKVKVTKKERRKMKSGYSRLACFYRIQDHFFPDLPAWFNAMDDPRHQSYIKYNQSVFMMQLMMKCNSGIESMRSMTHAFNTEEAIRNLGIIAGVPDLDEMPDWQTDNNYLEKLNTEELEEVKYKMIRKLIRTKDFKRSTMEGAYCVVIDGTDIAYFNKKHCEHDLVTKTIDKETGEVTYRYYHKALEAKILLGPELVLSIGTEFIENENEDVSKQDCELKAAVRLLDKLKKAFPKMRFIIIGDALFLTMPFMSYVKSKGWGYIFRAKAGRQTKLMEDFADLLNHSEEESVKDIYIGENGICSYINHVEEVTDKPEICNMIHYEGKVGDREISFDWVTDKEISKKNVSSLAHAGRNRWKIENEGFNVQKNGIYNLEHHCSLNCNAMKNHYIIIQIAHIIMQLYLAYDKVIYVLKEGYKKSAHDLQMAFAGKNMSDEDIKYAKQRTSLHPCCLLVN